MTLREIPELLIRRRSKRPGEALISGPQHLSVNLDSIRVCHQPSQPGVAPLSRHNLQLLEVSLLYLCGEGVKCRAENGCVWELLLHRGEHGVNLF